MPSSCSRRRCASRGLPRRSGAGDRSYSRRCSFSLFSCLPERSSWRRESNRGSSAGSKASTRKPAQRDILEGRVMTRDLGGLVLGIAIGIVIAWLYFLIWRLRYSATIREDAVQRSLAVTAGKVHEQLVPYLPEFGFNPKDARFLGSPVDLVVFDGLSAGDVRRIVFLEVKTGGAALTARERQVRAVIEAREVAWAELRLTRSPR